MLRPITDVLRTRRILAALITVWSVVVLAVPTVAHPQSFAYGPVEGYTFDIESEHTHTEVYLSVAADIVPMEAYYGLCIVTDHLDGRAGRDTTCGETWECSVDAAMCDDIEDPVMEGCAQGSFESPVPIGDDDLIVVEVRLLFVDETTGAMCVSGVSGSVHLELY